ncbi:MAG: class I SAM-dependent methyltransferase [Magnetococcales bacterium]|nr:class I SAM-dependent methyltransferase [Magnetococcales bacterium]NGZ28358.1 class I SAM-dependent methyltransferase [Magnetococcales bacterium]
MEVVVVAQQEDCLPLARSIAGETGLPLWENGAGEADYLLMVTPQGLEVQCRLAPREKPLQLAWLQGTLAYRCKQGGKEQLARAMGKGQPLILDATAGLGQDAFVLACQGYSVTMMERNPLLAALLRDGLQRLAQQAEGQSLALRLKLQAGDSVDYMLANGGGHEVVYLDPMYPQQPRKAAQKKEMRHLRSLLGEEDGGERLLLAALGYANRRVVVKRPSWAPPLPGPSPALTLPGSSTRFDIYLIQG